MDFNEIRKYFSTTELFKKEINDAPLVKNWELYFDDHSESFNGIIDLENGSQWDMRDQNINTAFREFHDGRTIDDKYYTPDKNQTNTFKIIAEIEMVYQLFKKNYDNSTIDRYKEPETVGNIIVAELSQLDENTALLICDKIIEDNDNIYLYITQDNEADKWKMMRKQLVLLIKHFKTSIENVREKPKTVKTFDEFVMPEWKKENDLGPRAKSLLVNLRKMIGIETQRSNLAKTILDNEGGILIEIEKGTFSDLIKTISTTPISKNEIDKIRKKYNNLKPKSLPETSDARHR